jgi:hypothetical protein
MAGAVTHAPRSSATARADGVDRLITRLMCEGKRMDDSVPGLPVPGDLVARFASLRQHQSGGHRSPHKPLLVLLALGRLAVTGSSAVPWSVAEVDLANLIDEFGHASRTGRAQSAAYPFTHLRSDQVWVLDAGDGPDQAAGRSHRQVRVTAGVGVSRRR